MADLEFRILGALEVFRGGYQLSIRRGSALNLLAGMLVSANKPLRADELAELAWGDTLPRHVRAALYSVVSRLRHLLGSEVIESVPGGYRLRTGADQLDVLRFEQLVTIAAELADEEAAATLTEAIALWRGQPLDGVESPVLAEAVRVLTERYLAACEDWARISLRLGRYKAVAELSASLVAAHPFRELIVGQLMLALHGDGRQAEALAAYERLRTALHDELGVDPGHEIENLYLGILRGEDAGNIARPSRRSTHRQPAWTGRRPPPGGLVGRVADLARLSEAVAAGRAVTLVGPPGAGKTALALEAASQVAGRFPDGVTVVELGTLPAQLTSDLTAVAGALFEAAGQSGTRTGAAEQALISALPGPRSLIVLDNAEHVSGPCAWLADIIEASCPGTGVIITSRRPLGRGSEKLVDLHPLSPSASAELLQRRMASYGVTLRQRADSAAITELCRLTGGLPLAVELAAARLRTMPLRALLRRGAGRPGLLTVEGRPGLAHDRSLASSVQRSYDLLTPNARLLLGRLSVFSGPFSLEAAEEVAGYPPFAEWDVAMLLNRLADDSLIQVQPDEEQNYRLLVPIRDFAASVADAEDLVTARRRHLSYACANRGQVPITCSEPSPGGSAVG